MDFFLLSLPPINLHTANLIWPYYNGIEFIRMNNAVVNPPEQKVQNAEISPVINKLIDAHNGVLCIAKCKLDKNTRTCTGCSRTIDDIVAKGLVARQFKN